MTDLLPWMKEKMDKYGGLVALYTMGQPTVITTKPEYVEVILTSTKNIDKGPEYKFISEWLGDGLLLSTGDKWKQRRKMLTPSFHFKILENNHDCMNKNWKKVVKTFLDAKGAPVEPLQIMGRGALDIICETAMGTILDKDDGGEEYVANVKRTTANSVQRALRPLYRSMTVLRLTPFGRQYLKDIDNLHNFTEKVINQRKSAYLEEKQLQADEYSESDGKKPQVFLDSILELAQQAGLTNDDIREEVDTFMFAGHDTTSTALQFVLLRLGENPEVQEKAYQEQLDIFGYSDRDVTKEDLNKMHYLDLVLKECLRLHPPAPQIARVLREDVTLPNNMIIPSGTKVLMNFFLMHRDPENFPNPEKFDPERFTHEMSKNRHPYSYTPFSAGPRNCIGQKFALMEMKIGLSTILRFCKIRAVTRSKDLKYRLEIILKPSTPILVEVTPRN
ncbi:cytochrome P450 [Nesidiocoris tenuis]|uniref:Cytochrome P450 n=1 Tax=Nesidiocoris tenuis TaxID=355587 RepID=A0ABN7B0X3_9HEMI|nr:cytochrome P450 [Nesidiocoris tenuis]